MAVNTHNSTWRLLVVGAPLLGVAAIVLAALQGEPEMALSRQVQAILAGVAALGTLVAGWTAWQLTSLPAVPVARAQPGPVSLRGRAQPLPGDEPLVSPEGEPCLWFHHGAQIMHHYNASDSVRPFLLVDDSGSCIVLPAGADITGRSKLPATGKPRATPVGDITSRPDTPPDQRERLLRVGDTINVVGRFVSASAEAIELQAKAALLTAQTALPRVLIRANDPAALAQALAAGPPPLPPLPVLGAPLALPVVAAPGGAQPFIISIGSLDGESGTYGLVALLDALIFIGSAAMLTWLTLSGR